MLCAEEFQAPSMSVSTCQDFKAKGNEFVKKKQFRQAIEAYSAAIEAKPAPTGRALAVVLSNRAHALLGLHATVHSRDYAVQALRDAKQAVVVDDTYDKAHYRCQRACQALGDAKAAAAHEASMQKCRRQSSLHRKKPSSTRTDAKAKGASGKSLQASKKGSCGGGGAGLSGGFLRGAGAGGLYGDKVKALPPPPPPPRLPPAKVRPFGDAYRSRSALSWRGIGWPAFCVCGPI